MRVDVASIHPSGRVYLIVGFVWLLLAIALGALGHLIQLRPPAPQVILLGLTAWLITAAARCPGFRGWLASLPLRLLVSLHLTRYVGAYFLVLYARRELPYAFAVPGGWGDIAVATAALILVLLVPHLLASPRLVLAWNLFGLFDILVVVGTAARLGFTDPSSVQALLQLPLSLLPTFLVPLIIASHVLIFARLRQPQVV